MRAGLCLCFMMLAVLVCGCLETGYQPTYIISHEPVVEEIVPLVDEVR